MTVDLFIPCFIDQIYPDTGFNTIKILEKCGLDVHYNPAQTCCGQPSFNSGYWHESKKLAEKFISDFNNNRPVICPSGSCAGYIRNYFPELFKNNPGINELNIFGTQVFELCDFLVNQLKITDFGAEFHARVTYHDACSALREYGLKDEPRILLRNVKGLVLMEMNENDVCCGFGGTFSVKYEAISSAMVQQKVENALATGAEYIVSTEASCLMNIEGYINKHKLPIKTIHIADVLSSGW
ncbi:MAG: (Fe-S)-binding protein [Bacteroidia bacterium]|nr:(Fe-S)-binding protein [Bacteroidia bacterium]